MRHAHDRNEIMPPSRPGFARLSCKAINDYGSDATMAKLTYTLNNGLEMPMLGYGVFQIPDLAECQRCVEDALEAGYRLIDTAASYGNEEAVGRAIRNSGIPRSDIFLTTKLWLKDAGQDATRGAVSRSLQRLDQDYVDLYLIHQPIGDIHGAWRAMERMYTEGTLKAIGLSNFAPDRIMDVIVTNEIVPAAIQIEIHPFHQQDEALAFAMTQNIHVEAWGPFAEGKNGLFTNPVLTTIASDLDRSVGQVVLRWLFQRGITAIPKTVRKERMVENLDILNFQLSDAQMQAIAQLDTRTSAFFDHRDPVMVQRLASFQRNT
jgi:2,5-diketo-D-gluconate reductase A